MIETVKVKSDVVVGNDLGYVVKNKDDLLDTDVLFTEKPEKQTKKVD